MEHIIFFNVFDNDSDEDHILSRKKGTASQFVERTA